MIDHFRVRGLLAVPVALTILAAGVAHAVPGQRCTSDDDCGSAGETCLTSDSSDFYGGGPAGGLCTVTCAEGGQATCDALDVGAVCLVLEEGAPDAGTGTAWCVSDCTATTANADKCGTRDDLACFRLERGTTEGSCQPLCGPESDCGERTCDPALGLCVDALPDGERRPVGSQCEPGGSAGQCDGTCEELTAGFAVCTALCVLGSGECASPPGGNPSHCLLPGDPDLARGDFGFCLQVCDCDDQCTHPDAVCVDLGASGVQATGFQGTCLPRGMATGLTGISCEPDAPPPEPEPDPEAANGCSCRIGRARRGPDGLATVALICAVAGLGASRRKARARSRGDGV